MNVTSLPLSARQNEPLFDRKLAVGGVTAAGFVLSVIMRSRCNAALQSCQSLAFGLPIECRIADAISFLSIAILGATATILAFQAPSRPELPV